MSRFPFFAFPGGWYRVAWSDELAPGAVVPLRYFGRDLVAVRGEDGAPRLYDALCPHLGAHLGYGGCLVDDTLRCPFHGWRFAADGACVAIPYSAKIPPRAQLRAWPVREVNGVVLAYQSVVDEAPAWEVPPLDELAARAWSPEERRRWRVRTHVQDVVENLVDLAHFTEVHGTALPAAQLELDQQRARSSLRMQMPTPRGAVAGGIDSELHGLGFTLVRFSGIVETLLLIAATPVDEESVELAFSFRTSGGASHAGAALVEEVIRQTEQDIVIWEHKGYRAQPLLCAGDGPIMALRKWARQFYGDAAR